MSIFDDDQPKTQAKRRPDHNEPSSKDADTLRRSLFGNDPNEHSLGANEDVRQEPSLGGPQSFKDDEFEQQPLDDILDHTREPAHDLQDDTEYALEDTSDEALEDGLETDDDYEHTDEYRPEPAPEPYYQSALDMADPRRPQRQNTRPAPKAQPAHRAQPFDLQEDDYDTSSRFDLAGVFNPGMRALVNWGVLAILIVVAIWNLAYQSETDIRLAGLANSLDRLSQNTGEPSDDATATIDQRLTSLSQRLDNLEKKFALASEQQNLSARLDALENNLQIAAEQAAKAQQKSAATKPPAPIDNWFINIAVLSDQKNATNLRDKLKSLGADGRIESYPSGGRTLHRVRAYGYSTKSAAEKDVRRLQTALNLSGFWVGEK